MNHWTNPAQAAADAIKGRREVVANLRLVAELIEDGLPAPISVMPTCDGVRVQVRHEHVTDWLILLDEPLPAWTPAPVGDGEHFEVVTTHLGTPLTLVAFRRTVAEVTC